jgi:CRP/FNR family cyclic AMP-dependent transcriptional regulator
MTYEPGTSETSVWKDLSRRVFAAGATIFAEGEVGTIAYILLRGDVFRRACVLDH